MNGFDHDLHQRDLPSGLELNMQGQIAVVTLKRPEKRNALTLSLWRGLAALAARLDARDDVRAVVLTGTGASFCAGADVAEFDTLRDDEENVFSYEETYESGCRAFETLGKPVIAAINGYCMGGGCNLALACDFRFAVPQATFAIPAARLSIVYGVAGSRRLFDQVGLVHAKRILFTGQRISAADALEMGMIDEIHDDACDAALRFADAMTRSAPLSIRGTKTILAGLAAAVEARCEADAGMAMRRAARSADYAEARAAFAEKREPRFRGA